MLQKLADAFPPEFVKTAQKEHASLARGNDELGAWLRQAEPSLPAKGELLQTLAAHFFPKNDVPALLIMMAREPGVPFLCDPSLAPGSAVELAKVRHDTAVLFVNPGGHCELVLNTSRYPLSDVLAQLQTAPVDPRAGPNVQWALHTIGARRPMEVRILRHDGTVGKHRWKLGMRTKLELPIVEGLGPALRAREMARAHHEVDTFLQTMEVFVWVYSRPIQSRGDTEFHELIAPPRKGQSDGNTGLLQVRQGRIIGLTLKRPGEGDIFVTFEHPWDRTFATAREIRARLTHHEDLDTFDAYSIAYPLKQGRPPMDLTILADFLIDVRGNAGGVQRFRKWTQVYRTEYVQAYKNRYQDPRGVHAVVERAIAFDPTPEESEI